MNATGTWIEPPPKQGMGCFGKGCLLLVVFAALLIIAAAAGIYWGLHSHSALGRGLFWLTKVHAVAEGPVQVPEFKSSNTEIEEVEARWQKFEEAAHEGQPAMIELSGRDINALIESNAELAGKMFASVDGNRLRFQVSLPLARFVGRAGHYFNADVVVESDGVQSLDHWRLNRVSVNNEPLPQDLLEWKFHSRRFGDYLSDYTAGYRSGSFEIRDGHLILRAGSD
ncbi:MAG: hypothetical protein ABI925_05470 [Verrucomicrobiota bacterium]